MEVPIRYHFYTATYRMYSLPTNCTDWYEFGMLRYCDLYRLGTIPVQKLYSEKDALIVLTNGTEQVQNMYIMYRGCSGPLSDDIE